MRKLKKKSFSQTRKEKKRKKSDGLKRRAERGREGEGVGALRSDRKEVKKKKPVSGCSQLPSSNGTFFFLYSRILLLAVAWILAYLGNSEGVDRFWFTLYGKWQQTTFPEKESVPPVTRQKRLTTGSHVRLDGFPNRRWEGDLISNEKLGFSVLC